MHEERYLTGARDAVHRRNSKLTVKRVSFFNSSTSHTNDPEVVVRGSYGIDNKNY